MIRMTLSSLRNRSDFFDIEEVATIINGRKREEIGYFVPKRFKKEFEKFNIEIQKKRKKELLQRVLKASKKDNIGDGAVSDGL